jgi:hypothetical protein
MNQLTFCVFRTHIVSCLQAKARGEGLWNLWLPADMAAKIAHLREKVPQAERHLLIGPGLSNLEYAFLSEVMGRSAIGSEVFNCSAPDTGNMEVSPMFLPVCSYTSIVSVLVCLLTHIVSVLFIYSHINSLSLSVCCVWGSPCSHAFHSCRRSRII